MIRSLHVDGYMGLRDTTLDMNTGGLTVLLGPNGSGKSSWFGALDVVGRLAMGHTTGDAFADEGAFRRLLRRGDPDQHMAFRARTADNTTWDIEIADGAPMPAVVRERITLADGEWVERAQEFVARSQDGHRVTGSLAPASVLLAFARDPGFPWPSHRATALGVVESVSPLRIAMFNPHHIAESPRVTQPVGPTGFGLPAALLALQNSNRRRFLEIEARFREMFAWVEEVQVPPQTPDPRGPTYVALQFKERGGVSSYPAQQVSAGMRLALALLWVVLRPDPDRILCYEEPENSFHPHLLAQVYALLSKAARGELGGPAIQVLVATHSVDFVNLCSADEVRVCERDAEGTARVHGVRDREDLKEAVAAYRGAMGELWYSGALGGVPGTDTSASSPGPR